MRRRPQRQGPEPPALSLPNSRTSSGWNANSYADPAPLVVNSSRRLPPSVSRKASEARMPRHRDMVDIVHRRAPRLSSQSKPIGSIRSTPAPRQAPSRRTAPTLPAISGSYRAIRIAADWPRAGMLARGTVFYWPLRS